MTEKHSPLKLPLTSVENSWQYTTIYEANGKELFRFDLEGWGVTERNQDRLEKRMAEVVGLIVRSVNGLPEAIAALEAVQTAHDSMFSQCCSNPIVNAWGKPVDVSALNEARRLADAALTKLKG